MFRDGKICLILALATTLAGSCIAYFLLGQPSLVGMDDANITQVYARNLSDGHGYVYTPGFERVEGSTSILWTLINAAAFFISPQPEAGLLGISLLLTVGAIYFSLRIFELLLRHLGLEKSVTPRIVSVFLLCMFGFYAWNVLSLMDLALWTFLLNGFVLTILFRIERGGTGAVVLLAVLSILMVLARPEAMALVPLVLLVGVAGEWKLAPRPKETLWAYGLSFFGSC